MARKTTSIQDILLEEIKQLREENREKANTLTEAVTILREVKEQTTRTNGRVNKLEERVNVHRGGLTVAYIILSVIIIPLLVAWLK